MRYPSKFGLSWISGNDVRSGIFTESIFTKYFNITRKMVYPAPDFFFEMDCRTQRLIDGDRRRSSHQVVGMGDNPFFNGTGNAVARRQVKERALIGRQTGTGMAFDNTCNGLWDTKGTASVCTDLGMKDGVGCAAPDVMEHRSGFKQSAVDEGIISGEPECIIRDRVAVCDHT
jgi:hypothetical protein